MTMNKQLLLLALFVLVSSFFVAASAADVKFVLPSPIVRGVPFNFEVQMSSNAEAVARVQLYVTSTGKNVNFLSSGLGEVWLAASTVNQNEQQDGGKAWKYNVGPKGAVNENTAAGAFKRVITLRAQTNSDDTLTLTGTSPPDNIIAHYPDGASLGISLATSAVVTSLSACGDGVVGYFDDGVGGGTVNNGVKDGTETDEACDDGAAAGSAATDNYAANKDGCSADCKVIDLGYRVSPGKSCSFGSYVCQLALMEPREFLIVKLTALLNGQCYPDCQHPGALYKNTVTSSPAITYDAEGKLSPQEKINLVVQVGTALREFFSQVVST